MLAPDGVVLLAGSVHCRFVLQWNISGVKHDVPLILALAPLLLQPENRRLYCEEKLTMRKHGGRKRALGTKRPLVLPSHPNERWSLDFVSDAFTDDRCFRVLAVVDAFTRE